MCDTRDRGERVDSFYGCLVIPVENSIHKFHQGIVAHIGEFFQNAPNTLVSWLFGAIPHGRSCETDRIRRADFSGLRASLITLVPPSRTLVSRTLDVVSKDTDHPSGSSHSRSQVLPFGFCLAVEYPTLRSHTYREISSFVYSVASIPPAPPCSRDHPTTFQDTKIER